MPSAALDDKEMIRFKKKLTGSPEMDRPLLCTADIIVKRKCNNNLTML